MDNLPKILAVFTLLAVFAVPQTASALGISFGGLVVTALPCVSASGPAYFVTTKPAGSTFLTPLIWTSQTLLIMTPPRPSFPPPTLPGQQVLGVADIPYSCLIGKVPVYGMRMQIVFTSLVPLNPAAFTPFVGV